MPSCLNAGTVRSTTQNADSHTRTQDTLGGTVRTYCSREETPRGQHQMFHFSKKCSNEFTKRTNPGLDSGIVLPVES
jgi:hypothetical protein